MLTIISDSALYSLKKKMVNWVGSDKREVLHITGFLNHHNAPVPKSAANIP